MIASTHCPYHIRCKGDLVSKRTHVSLAGKSAFFKLCYLYATRISLLKYDVLDPPRYYVLVKDAITVQS